MREGFCLSCLVIFAAGCSSYEPLQVVSAFDQGTWVGTFSSTQDFGSDGSIVQSGSVTFEFGPSDYTYDATVRSMTNRTKFISWGVGTELRDRGLWMKSDLTVKMTDAANLRATDILQRSLYLHGAYFYSSFGRSMHISRVETGVTFNFVLDKQN
ncbi:MAG: hypothetical protein AUI33_14815 [Ignavibacteria bacterium 13_1_40CM_2_61_4]|nr:MAG: hypothetical protein AUI33_14815 [Ignavibacteria bacterium 13_1_40CM_2_61_4]